MLIFSFLQLENVKVTLPLSVTIHIYNILLTSNIVKLFNKIYYLIITISLSSFNQFNPIELNIKKNQRNTPVPSSYFIKILFN